MTHRISVNMPDFTTCFPKVVALDLDGTLLKSDASISLRTQKILLELSKLGIPIIIATARPLRVISSLVGKDIYKRASHVHLSGAVIKGRKPFKGSKKWLIDRDTARKSWDVIMQSKIEIRMTMETDGKLFAISHHDENEKFWTLNDTDQNMIIDLNMAISRGPTKISVDGLGKDLSDLIKIIESKQNLNTVITADFGNTFLNIHSKNASKGQGVEWLTRSAGLSMKDVISFGDDLPDANLLKNTGWSVAVANAIPEILELAKYKTFSNENDGVASVLEKLSGKITKKLHSR